MKSHVLIDIAEAFRNQENTTEFYKELVQILMDAGLSLNELEDCFGADDTLDQVIEEVLDQYDTSDDSDDDWIDGGREQF